ncbi:MAG: 4Fe-4S binding protein [Acidobacteria bacterium]|nr:4Fe-4S binding protein [Acidobacteriota bacterium]
MAHLTVRSAYRRLTDRINRFPQGAPPSHLLYQILELLFSEEEAELVSLLPIRPFTVSTAARAWKKNEAEAQAVLDNLASRGILLDIVSERTGTTRYVLPPPMAGFFEFSMMRVRDDLDQKLLSELYYQYITVEDDFIKALFTKGETQLGRTFVNERALPAEPSLEVLDYERATQVIRTASHIGVGVCYCRHKAQHLGEACDAPMNICMTFNAVAASLTRHGVARTIDRSECMDLLDLARDENLVQFGENVREGVSFICNCCGCCCEAMIAARRFGMLHPVHTTNYLPEVDTEACAGCGKCAEVCPVEAMGTVSANDPHKPKRKMARLDTDICLGCGVCVRTCPSSALRLVPRAQRVLPPLSGTHKAVVMAIERGKLQNLIFDHGALASHRAMAAILGVVLKLPPVKQALASRQLQSRYLERLIARYDDH